MVSERIGSCCFRNWKAGIGVSAVVLDALARTCRLVGWEARLICWGSYWQAAVVVLVALVSSLTAEIVGHCHSVVSLCRG